jgi:hypothetical protein
MAKPRRQYTDEFKLNAVRMLRNRGTRTVAQVADDLGVAATFGAVAPLPIIYVRLRLTRVLVDRRAFLFHSPAITKGEDGTRPSAREDARLSSLDTSAASVRQMRL